MAATSTAAAAARLPAFLTLAKGRTQLAVAVKPNARIAGVAWVTDGDGVDVLELRSMEPPREGAANDDVVKQLSKALGVPKSALELVAGHKSRQKVLALAADPQAVLAKLAALKE